MTIAFFFILILNCFVIFAADALLGSVENINKTLVIEATTANSAFIDSLKSSAAPYLPESDKTGALDLGFAEGNSFKVPHNESGKRTIVGRKGVKYQEDTSSTPKSEYTSPTLDKVPTSSATIANTISKNVNTSTESLPSPNNAASTSSTTAAVADNNKTISANSTEQLLKYSTSSTTTTTTQSSSSSSTTTSTSKPPTIALRPMKPTITYSVDDNPKLLEVPIQSLPIVAGDKKNHDEELPISQPSRELQFDYQTADRQRYVIPIIALIFAVPMVLGMVTVFTRRFKHYWSTRHYRRMDFLVDGMYNT